MEARAIDVKILPKKLKKCSGGALIGSLFVLLVLMYGVMKNSIGQSSLSSLVIFNTSDSLKWIQAAVPPAVPNPEASNRVISADILVSGLFLQRNFSEKVKSALQTWNHMKRIIDYTQGLPNAVEAIREAGVVWDSLMNSTEKEQNGDASEISLPKTKENQCPYFLNKMNAKEFGDNSYRLQIPCGLVQGSAITVIGTPNGLLGNFQIDFTGESLKGEPNPPIILHYNVRLHGDKLTEDPVIVQNTWTAAHGWGEEERCPSAVPGNNKKVDELNQCNQIVGKDDSQRYTSAGSSNVSMWSVAWNRSKPRAYFPFKQRYPSVMTLRVGEEGIQMTVDGKHTTSFAYRERLEPWLVSEVQISGDLELISVLASGLPTSEDLDNVADLEALTSVPLPPNKPLNLFIGVFSTANNFKRRMAVRRTWMQYPAVKSGSVAVRFFVGLHKNQMVNEELWKELQTYGDIQLMPFVDYYSLITWKTLAICTFGTQAVSAKYVMKTDDDSFVRVDEVIASLERANVTHGLLYGLINSNARPHRNPDSKWYITQEEWREETYPPWAHGPGYVVSNDIAKAVYKTHGTGHLKMFKLEDVAMGIWIEEMKRGGLQVSYVKEERVYNEGCKDGYVVAHYQSPREMLCLWQKLQEGMEAKCCRDR
ncbi:hypothetical protein F0562_005082 [Nyssa sinensis]|uniref:Galectin domain-containing protein n=1 Tax=Nyssa sinensis TaxID=561372 RepID=A0A5J5AH74_9ASTE|nr:hypothetical protein F0562_005082 [Nyssa sinensis]